MKFFRERVTQPRYNPSRAQHSTLLLIRISDYSLVHNHISHVNRYIGIKRFIQCDKCQMCGAGMQIGNTYKRYEDNNKRSLVLFFKLELPSVGGVISTDNYYHPTSKKLLLCATYLKLMITKSTIRLGREPTPYCLLFTRAL